MRVVTLSTGAQMPLLGLGTWQSKPGEVKEAVKVALDAGYRLIDTALVYGNEKEIGEAIKEHLDQGKLTRKDLFITTKVWTPFFKRSNVTECMKRSLANLQLDFVDLYLVHVPVAMKKEDCSDNFMVVDGKPVFEDVPLEETWKGMEDVYNASLAKAIGMSNFNLEQVQRIFDTATVKPHNLQVECHGYFPQFELQELCNKLGITFTAYAPIGSPGRVDFRPPGRTMNWPEPGDLLKDPKVLEIVKSHKKSAAQVLLRWLIQRNISAIPKSTNASRIRENFDVFDFELNELEMGILANLPIRQRLFLQEFLTGGKEDPLKDERIA